MHRLPFLMMSMMNKRRFRDFESDEDEEEAFDIQLMKKQKLEEEGAEETKESSLFPFLNTNVIQSYALPSN